MDILIQAIKDGYLLHGSQYFISGCLEPRQSSDKAKASGNQRAIFATSNVTIALWKAVANRFGDHSTVGWSWDDFGDKVLYAEGNVSPGNGYVYVLPKDSFQTASDDAADHFSHTPVIPIQVVKVTYQDLLDLQSEIGFKIEFR